MKQLKDPCDTDTNAESFLENKTLDSCENCLVHYPKQTVGLEQGALKSGNTSPWKNKSDNILRGTQHSFDCLQDWELDQSKSSARG